MALTIETGREAPQARTADRPRPTSSSASEANLADYGSLLALLDAVDYGLMLVSSEATLIHANASAARELDDGRILKLQGRMVRPCDDERLPAFTASVARAASGLRSLMTLDPRAGVGFLAAVPVAGAASTGRALLVLGKRRLCEPLSIEFFARTHGITGAEARVLQGLCEGLPPSTIASAAHVAVSTVRTHISNIREKTGTPSIRDLINRIAALPPIVTALGARG